MRQLVRFECASAAIQQLAQRSTCTVLYNRRQSQFVSLTSLIANGVTAWPAERRASAPKGEPEEPPQANLWRPPLRAARHMICDYDILYSNCTAQCTLARIQSTEQCIA